MSSQRQSDEYVCVGTGEQLQTFTQRTCRAPVDSCFTDLPLLLSLLTLP